MGEFRCLLVHEVWRVSPRVIPLIHIDSVGFNVKNWVQNHSTAKSLKFPCGTIILLPSSNVTSDFYQPHSLVSGGVCPSVSALTPEPLDL